MNRLYEVCISKLKNAGMIQAAKKPEHFYRHLTDKTAFILNLYPQGDKIRIVYGITSTAFFAFGEGDRIFFSEFGRSDDDITLRRRAEISGGEDAAAVSGQIEAFYTRFSPMDKDALLAHVKIERKAFIQSIARMLKPLQFRKKGNLWTRLLPDGRRVEFHAQKSSFSDQYYFNITIFSIHSTSGRGCYYSRITAADTAIFDWQLIPPEKMEKILTDALEQQLLPILNMPREELGALPWIWQRCACKLDCCEDCWVEHNLWQAQQMGL